MNRIRVSAKTWVLVCDGSKALLFQNAGDAQAGAGVGPESADLPAFPGDRAGADGRNPV